MVNVIQTPVTDKSGYVVTNNHYDIVGDNIDELIDECVKRIRPQSVEFYKKSLRSDLINERWSVISRHAAQGTPYKVVLL